MAQFKPFTVDRLERGFAKDNFIFIYYFIDFVRALIVFIFLFGVHEM